MKTVFLVGPFDRYNYGDLLFPNVLTKMLEPYKIRIKYLAYQQIDLTNVGGFKVKLMQNLYQRGYVNDQDVIIVVGGDSLAVNFRLVNYQLGGVKLIKKCESLLLNEKGLQAKFNVKSKMPWVINKNDFQVDVKIGYNAVGGLEQLTSEYKINCLAAAEYLSCRDIKNSSLDARLNAISSPDSAFIISDLYPKKILRAHANVKLKSNFIVFQVQASSYFKKRQEILKNLRAIDSKEQIYLLVIGYAQGHDDKVAYEDILKSLDYPSNMSILDDLDVFEIMHVISESNFFMGTSLHGNLTAMTYLVPHMGLDVSIKKLATFYQDFEKNDQLVEFENLSTSYQKYRQVKVDVDNVVEIKHAVKVNFEQMFKSLGL